MQLVQRELKRRWRKNWISKSVDEEKRHEQMDEERERVCNSDNVDKFV